jgi:benzaldehyde dehydrogenase (NAD)
VNFTSSTKLLEKDVWQYRVYTGQWCNGSGKLGVVEPATGQSLGSVGVADANFVALSTATAHAAQPHWAALPYDQRAAIMRRAAQLLETHSEEIVDWILRESGSTRLKASFEVSITIKAIQEAAALPSRSAGEVLPSMSGGLSLARRRPLGVVGVIAPFNFPLYLAVRAIAPALALGNAVVLKPDPRTSVSGGVVIARLFELAGVPAGVLHMLPGDGTAGAALTSDPHVAMIQFTGSTSAGRKVGEMAGRHLKKVSLELGGKNSLIVLDDADLDLAIANTAWGVYLHQGQICMSTGRVLVQRSIYQRFVEKVGRQGI